MLPSLYPIIISIVHHQWCCNGTMYQIHTSRVHTRELQSTRWILSSSWPLRACCNLHWRHQATNHFIKPRHSGMMSPAYSIWDNWATTCCMRVSSNVFLIFFAGMQCVFAKWTSLTLQTTTCSLVSNVLVFVLRRHAGGNCHYVWYASWIGNGKSSLGISVSVGILGQTMEQAHSWCTQGNRE